MSTPASSAEQRLLDDVRRFLKVTLTQELLSPASEKQRQELLQRLSTRESSPASYLDMNCSKKSFNADIGQDVHEFYEVFNHEDIIKNSRRKSDISYLKSTELYNELNINKDNYVMKNLHRKSLNSVLGPELIVSAEKFKFNGGTGGVSEQQSRCIDASESSPKTIFNGGGGPASVSSSVNSESLSSSTSTLPQESDTERTGAAPNAEVVSISASALKYSAIKHGILSRKEKVLKAFEKMKKYWVGVLGHSLYIYNNEKDLRPQTVIDLLGYTARPVSIKENSNASPKKDFTFEIVCPGKKTHQFTASNWPEMETWILIISQAGNQPTPLQSPTTPQSSNGCFFNERSLPATPVTRSGLEQIYDEPDSKIRPVEKSNLRDHFNSAYLQQYEFMGDDSFYHYIDETMKENLKNMKDSCSCNQIKNENYYNNIEEENRYCSQCEKKSNMYYNMLESSIKGQSGSHPLSCSSLPSIPIEQEAIYDIIVDGQRQQINGLTDRDKLINGILCGSNKGGDCNARKNEEGKPESTNESNVSSDGDESDRSSKENADFNVQKAGLYFANQSGSNRIQDIINRIETTFNNKNDPVPINKRISKSNLTALPKRSSLNRSVDFKSNESIFGSQKNSSLVGSQDQLYEPVHSPSVVQSASCMT